MLYRLKNELEWREGQDGTLTAWSFDGCRYHIYWPPRRGWFQTSFRVEKFRSQDAAKKAAVELENDKLAYWLIPANQSDVDEWRAGR